MVSRAPLATFLASTAPPAPSASAATPASPNAEPAPSAAASAEKPSAAADMQEGARAVILTILSYASPISGVDLKAKSEIETDLYEKTLKHLAADGLIVEQPGGYALSDKGIGAAAVQRARILSIA
jgi:hypothetical protein